MGFTGKGKFSDRLKRMKLFRYSIGKGLKVKDGVVIDTSKKVSVNSKFKESVGVVTFISGSILSNLIYDKDGEIKVDNNSKSKLIDDNVEKNISTEVVELNDNNILNKAKVAFGTTFYVTGSVVNNLVVNKNSSKGIEKKDNGKFIKDKKDKLNKIDSELVSLENVDEDRLYLASLIIKKLRKEIDYNLGMIDVLESELFLLNDDNRNSIHLDECRRIREEIDKIMSKINHIIKECDIYKHNKFLYDMLDMDNSSLIDNISDYKRLYEIDDIKKNFYGDYDLLDKYKSLYVKIDKIKEEVSSLYENNFDKIDSLDIRDKKYSFINDRIVHLYKFNNKFKNFIIGENEYIKDIENKVSSINVSKVVDYRLKGFGELVGGTFRYLSLLAMSPFRGLFPSIYFSTNVANRRVKDLYRALTMEKVTSFVYSVDDLQFELNSKINDIDYNYRNVDNTLFEISKLKNEFMNMYSSDLPNYDETLKKINDIENLVYGNRIKLDLIKDRLIDRKKINEDTLNKCRKLQNDSKVIRENV